MFVFYSNSAPWWLPVVVLGLQLFPVVASAALSLLIPLAGLAAAGALAWWAWGKLGRGGGAQAAGADGGGGGGAEPPFPYGEMLRGWAQDIGEGIGELGRAFTGGQLGAGGGGRQGRAGGGRGGGRRVRNTHAERLSRMQSRIFALPIEEYVREKRLYGLPVHELKQRLKSAGVPQDECAQMTEKRELVARLVEKCGGTDATTCSICFEEYEDGDVLRVLPGCGHRYHIECLDKWALAATDFSRPPACPLCNKEI